SYHISHLSTPYVSTLNQDETIVHALDMVLTKLPKGVFPVHHSDRGCQYCSHRYVEALKTHGLSVSRNEELHCYENARAERDIETGIRSWLFV
ncbi:MAG: hypothetical protein LBP76_12310, partial [Treponema sp.]|nr:hypothetical protein [Treponema sp.]